MNILVAEDDPETRTTFEIILKREGHNVVLALDGGECISIYKKSKKGDVNFFDTVIVDYQMPKINGLQCAREISKLNPNQKLLLVTGHPIVEGEIELRNLKVLRKPLTTAELVLAVKARRA